MTLCIHKCKFQHETRTYNSQGACTGRLQSLKYSRGAATDEILYIVTAPLPQVMTRLENELYLREHPEIRVLLSSFVRCYLFVHIKRLTFYFPVLLLMVEHCAVIALLQ